jgi:hypothetical protein
MQISKKETLLSERELTARERIAQLENEVATHKETVWELLMLVSMM